MLKKYSTALVLLAVPLTSSFAATHIIHAPTVIETPVEQPLTEPRAAANPANADHVLVGAIVAPSNEGDPWDCAVFASFDRGESWSTWRMNVERCIDPWLEFVDSETVVFAAIRIASSGQGEDRLRLVISTSLDGGRTWATPVEAGRNFEHPIIVADGDGALILTRRGETSADGQPRHFLEVGSYDPATREYHAVAVIRPSNAQMTNTGFLKVGGEGLYASFYDYGRNVGGFSDAGMLSTARAWGLGLNRDGKSTVPLLITDRCGGQKSERGLFPGYPYLASGDGHLYHVCIAPDHDGVLFASTMDGENWTASRRIDAASGAAGFALTPMLATNDNGGVVVAWQDRRKDPRCQQLLVVTSVDHGRSFSPQQSLDRHPSCPLSAQNGRAGRSWPGGGDYSSIAVDRTGSFHIVWAETVEGRYRLAHAIVGASE